MLCVIVLSMVCVVQLRNKPREPPRRPQSAPFFLPTVAGLEPKFKLTDDSDSAGLHDVRGYTVIVINYDNK